MKSDRNKFLRRLFAAAAASAWVAAGAQAAALYDNLSASRDGSDPVLSYGPLANSFSTGSVAGALDRVQLLLTNLSGAYAGNLSVLLMADAATAPGTALATLGTLAFSAVSTAGPASYAFAPAASVALNASTRYWVELVGSAPGAVEWSWSNDMASVGVAGEYSASAILGVNANGVGAGPYQMLVQVSAVPEPAPLTLAAASLAGALALRAWRRHAPGRTG